MYCEKKNNIRERETKRKKAKYQKIIQTTTRSSLNLNKKLHSSHLTFIIVSIIRAHGLSLS